MERASPKTGLTVGAIGLGISLLGPLLMSVYVVEDTSAYLEIVLRGAAVSVIGLTLAGVGGVLAVRAWLHESESSAPDTTEPSQRK